MPDASHFPAERGSPLEVLAVATGLGLTSFGGPIAHLGYFRREYVERRGWLDDTTYGELVALCQFLPGPASSQLGIAIGTRRAGILGGVMAWIGFTLPSAVALVALALLTASVDLATAGWVRGLKLAAVAVVAQAVILMAVRLAPDWRRRAMAGAAAAVSLVLATPLSQVAIIAAGAVVGWLVVRATDGEPLRSDGPSPVSRRLGIAAIATFVVLLGGLPLLRLADGQPAAVVDTFYRVGALVFGGGHVVLPLLHSTVVDPGWVSNDRFLAGYGAAQAVPGPLFSFAAYLGAASGLAPAGVLGAALALAAIYLPSFLLIFGTLPFWHELRGSARFRRALAGTNAAVVGILVATLYTPIWTSAVGAPVDVAVALAAFGLLMTGRVPPIAVVALCALAGQLS